MDALSQSGGEIFFVDASHHLGRKRRKTPQTQKTYQEGILEFVLHHQNLSLKESPNPFAGVLLRV